MPRAAEADLHALDHRIRDLRREESNGTQCVVVPGDHVVHFRRVAVGVNHRNHGDTELACFLHRLVFVCAPALAGNRVGDAEAEAAIREREDLVRRRRRPVAARVRNHDDLELEALGGMDREQPHCVASLLLGDCLELTRADGLLVANEADETLDVRSPQLLVRTCEPRQLAQVRVPPPAVPLRQDGEVVVVLGDDALAQTLERQARGRGRQAVVPLAERVQQLDVAFGKRIGEVALQCDEERPFRGGPSQQEKRVVRAADER